jgi:sugar phosphate isomerase/epimerase
MKLSTITGSRLSDFPSEEARYDAIASAGFRYVNYDFANISFDAPAGMEYMQQNWKQTSQAHLEKMKGAGLTPVQAHAPCVFPLPESFREPFLAAVIRTIECCGVMGIDRIVVHPDARKGMSQDEFLSVNREFYRSLIPAAEQNNVTILIENIGQVRDPHFVRNGKELRQMIEAVEHPLFAACWDTGHANHILDDQSESIRTLGSLLKGLHINDNIGDLMPPNQIWRVDMHTLPLFGTTNFDGIIHALKEIGYTGYFNFECDVPRPADRRMPFAASAKIDAVLPEVRRHTLALLHTIGKLMLTAYDCYEE